MVKTVIVYGIEHKGSTYNVVQLFKNKLNLSENQIQEYFLPKDMPQFCIGCNNCFMKGEKLCPHQDYITPIKEAMWDAELIILASPVYVLHVTGQMKTFLDHFAFQFMLHRPNKTMFSKKALVIAVAAGGGISSALTDMIGSLKNWGISHIFKFGFPVYATNWDDVKEKRRLKIERKIKKISRKIKEKINASKPSLKTKILFYIFRAVHKKFGFIQYDKEY